MSNLPLTQQERYERISEIGISNNQIDAVIRAELDDVLIQGIEGKIDDSIPPLPAKAWATAILENSETIPFPVLASSIHLRESNLLTREGVIPISKLAINSNISNSNLVSWMQKKVSDLGYSPANTDDVEIAIDEAINEMNEMVKDRGFGAIGPLMGVVMKKLGGTADGKLVNKLLKSKIEDLIE